MSDAEFNALMELAEAQLKEKVTREEALRSFVEAGILDWDANFREPYTELEGVFAELFLKKKVDPNIDKYI
ncbi:hypothetical protein HGH92_06255 [Chitinophaga varians]|uniref:Uncharacterized protein n=1 Tax=Chitinophaga varians TaxID=2202339 RepID=A0A847R9Y9_9BACT|nr:hypothetical protein [Chitinophaga varians]NLR63899.1 hypothetical protein [Chitinophaga varians]